MNSAFDIMYAATYRGPYSKIGSLPMHQMNAARNDSAVRALTRKGSCILQIEDPFIFFDESASVWRVLMHQYVDCRKQDGAQTDNSTVASGLAASGLPLVGGYAVSETSEIFGKWRYSFTSPAYGAQVAFSDGTTVQLGGRERPKVFFGDDGRPELLTNGVPYFHCLSLRSHGAVACFHCLSFADEGCCDRSLERATRH